MFGSNYISQRNSQSIYESSYHPSLFESNPIPQYNLYPLSNSNMQNPQPNMISQCPLIFSQYSNMKNNLNGERSSTQQSFTSSNFINYKQFENIFFEKIKNFPTQVNDYLTKEGENRNLKILVDSVNNASLKTSQKMKKINETYCNKISISNCCVSKLFEICSKINVLLNVIDNELVNQFSSLTSFHGYDESVQNEEIINLNKIQDVINECNDLLKEKIMKIDDNTMNLSNEINNNCEQFRIILGEEMCKLIQNLNDLINFKKEKNRKYSEYEHLIENIENIINSLKNKFIFSSSENDNVSNDKIIVEKENIDTNVANLNENKNENLNIDKNIITNMDENSRTQNKKATLKIISEMRNRNKKKRKK